MADAGQAERRRNFLLACGHWLSQVCRCGIPSPAESDVEPDAAHASGSGGLRPDDDVVAPETISPDDAARIVTRAVRRQISKSSYKRMMETGSLWEAQCARRCDFGHQKMALSLESGRRCCATGPLRERPRVRLGSPDCCSNQLPLNWVWQQVCAQIKPLVWLVMALSHTNLRLRSNRLAFGPWPLSQRRAHWAWDGLPDRSSESIRQLSKINILALMQKLSPLTHEESEFLGNFYDRKFQVTHFSNANLTSDDGITSIYSKQKLEERGIEFNAGTEQYDIDVLSNTDFVFFALDAGEGKDSSRFGNQIYKFDFNNPVFTDVSWMSLTEMANLRRPDLRKYIQGLSPEDYKKFRTLATQYWRDGLSLDGAKKTVFYGKDMLPGLALSILSDCRDGLSTEGSNLVLSMRTDDEVNSVINGFYRPEIKVPRHFYSNPIKD